MCEWTGPQCCIVKTKLTNLQLKKFQKYNTYATRRAILMKYLLLIKLLVPLLIPYMQELNPSVQIKVVENELVQVMARFKCNFEKKIHCRRKIIQSRSMPPFFCTAVLSNYNILSKTASQNFSCILLILL